MDRWTAYAETWYIAFLRWYRVKHEYRCSFSYYNRFHRKLCEIFAIREQPRRLIFAPFVTRPIYDPFFSWKMYKTYSEKRRGKQKFITSTMQKVSKWCFVKSKSNRGGDHVSWKSFPDFQEVAWKNVVTRYCYVQLERISHDGNHFRFSPK